MSALFTSSVVISIGVVGVAYALWARFRPRVTFRAGSQQVGTTRVFDGSIDLATRKDEGASVSGYICYIRRARQKGEFPTLP